jgi:predicted O-methyltransferase YrrM
MKPTIDTGRIETISNILNNSGAKTGVEIGVFKGEFSRNILERWNGTLYLVDPWRELSDEEYLDSSNHKNHRDAFAQTMEAIKGFENRAFMLRGLGEEMVHLFKDNSLDYIYIDGNHDYDHVKQDLELWWPKLKAGGLLAGHDYLLVDWLAARKMDNGKDIHVWADGYQWSLRDYPGRVEDGYAGVFGVNPAVEEFVKEHELEYELTNEWTSSFIIIKPKRNKSK